MPLETAGCSTLLAAITEAFSDCSSSVSFHRIGCVAAGAFVVAALRGGCAALLCGTGVLAGAAWAIAG